MESVLSCVTLLVLHHLRVPPAHRQIDRDARSDDVHDQVKHHVFQLQQLVLDRVIEVILHRQFDAVNTEEEQNVDEAEQWPWLAAGILERPSTQQTIQNCQPRDHVG